MGRRTPNAGAGWGRERILGLDYWPEEKPTCLQRREVYNLDQMKEKIFSFSSHRIRALTGGLECVCWRYRGTWWQRGQAVKDNDKVLTTSLYAAFQRWFQNVWKWEGKGIRRQRVMTPT